MNLNPLKKDDNTDALVKALEDANNMGNDTPGATQPSVGLPGSADPAAVPAPAQDSAAIAADPQIMGDVSAATPVEMPAAQSATAEPVAAPAADATTPLSFNNDSTLPTGISDDASATLPTPTLSDNGDIDTVKKSALEELRPLIEKLDLEPADKFDKYLMMLRASDDPSLIKPAFEAAEGIAGEKEKAQALLDIINEINYITANQQQAE